MAASSAHAGAADAPLSKEDCAVWVALGRAYLGWGTAPPNPLQFQIFYRPQGAGYVEQCPWRALGVTPLPPGKPDPDNFSFFTGPDYSDAGRKAVVRYGVKLTAKDVAGKPRPRFMEGWTCTLTKTGGRWTFAGCDESVIT
ncbi:MAG TPA: hypothetical protein VKU90_10705 [Caulobacteraceae bacterium]|nr:hypothetical protein [Caulobacteraceae bacterium]